MATKNQDGTLSIEAWSLVEFLPQVIKAHEDGYVLDIDNNIGVPQQYGAMVTVTMFPKPEPELVLKVQDKVVGTITDLKVNGTDEDNSFIPSVTEVTTAAPVQRGRPKTK